MLLSRLIECGISSKMIHIIIGLYTNVMSCVKLNNSIKDELRQGDSLSPILFPFYINDLPSKLSQVNTSTDIDILLYADDLAILARSRENVLSVYCKDRNLNVNVNKTKVMVFNSIKNT